jgi:hypothetical protein
MLLGVALDMVAVPPLIDNEKSLASNDPLSTLVLYTASLIVTAMVLLSDAKDTDDIIGGVPSKVQVYWVAAVLLLPAASVNVLATTSMVAAPSAVGVNVAVYTVLDVAEKLLKAPLVTVISPTANSVVASLLVKVTVKEASLVVEPVLTAVPTLLAAVMVMVGAVLSTVIVAPLVGAVVMVLPAASLPVARANV